jgi:hypothetical protein
METEKDRCVICGKETEYTRDTHIDQRVGYVEGAGQLCGKCYVSTYPAPQRNQAGE